MRYKDKSRQRKLAAPDEIRAKYAAKPIIALYQDEADAIIDHVTMDDLDGFYEWLDSWSRFIFKEANFVIKPRAKGESLYAAYSVVGGKFRVAIFSDECPDYATVWVDPAELDVEEGNVISVDTFGNPIATVFVCTHRKHVEQAQREEGVLRELSNRERAEDAVRISMAHSKVGDTDGLVKRLEELHAKLEDSHERDVRKLRHDLFCRGAGRTSLMILATLYHFQKRAPKTYLEGNEQHTEGYSRHNDLYNPLKRLNPPAIVRPRNGTRSWFEQQRARHTESWHVKGHSRVLKAERYKGKRGQTIWVNPFVKGSGENMRLSVYVDQVGTDVVEVENA